ncbi:hypothetical protein [Bordetella petrii]|uniref:hypothetical protein n=1 Tax=Bordetella petrii TaxID=94624 RepID=UPI001A9669D6|nr:hypothetical protein [Bordetella petrii]MBO1111810.1 hypothetical protein [Bordetella petrii]
MTSLYKNIPYVLPGSTAADAVDEVNAFWQRNGGNVAPKELEKFVDKTLRQHGVDPVTAAASARTASLMAEENPAGALASAEQLTGITVADPTRVAATASGRVNADLSKTGKTFGDLSRDEKISLAQKGAMQTLADAGVPESEASGPVQQEVARLIDAGVPPDEAAAAAAAAVMSQMLPQADSFNIFGYLSMMVHQRAEYTFMNTETLEIGGSAFHTHAQNTKYDMAGHDINLRVTDTLKTSSTREAARSKYSLARGIYEGTYESYVPVSYQLYWQNVMRRGIEAKNLGIASLSVSGVRFYVAGYDSDVVISTKASDSERDGRAALLELILAWSDNRKAKKTHIKKK